jgi:NADH dehydrogenase FAD-containing subunit
LGDDVVDAQSGEIRTRPTGQVHGFDNVFAVGDCAQLGNKFAFAADLQGKLAAQNIIKLIQSSRKSGSSAKLDTFKPVVA